MLIPGVVTHHTVIVEHPDLVADRLVRLAELVGPDNVNSPASAWALQIVLSCLDHMAILGEVEAVEGTDPQRWALR
jgi:hypothetical protein